MATTITAGNSTNGAAISSDNTGTLDIKTGTGAGTTAISIDASQNVAIPGTLTVGGVPAGGNYAMNAYVAPATWTKPTGLKAVKVTVVGAGGNSGAQPVATANGCGGGGGGGAAIEYIPAPSIPGPVAVTAGPGTNSFGPFCSATAGAAGSGATRGTGGSGSGGTINFPGGDGSPTGPTGNGPGGMGGASILGAGGSCGGNSPTVIPGTNGGNYGGGGGGAGSTPANTTKAATTGAPGIVIIEEFY